MSSTNPSRAPSSARILTWLNPRRLWWQGLVLAVGIWSVVLIDFATPSAVDRAGNIKFQDFLPFYVSGVLASQHRTSDFYSQQVTSRLMAGIVPAAAHVTLPFLYGPQVALFFEPFAGLPFPLAAWLWVAINVILYALCSLALWRDCDRLRPFPGLLILLAMAFPPFFHSLVRAQNSALALAFFSAAYLALSKGHRLTAGFAFGMLIFKPQLALATLIVMLIALEGKILVGFLVSAAAQVGIAWAFAGTATLHVYISLLWHFRTLLASIEPSLADAHCLRAFWTLILPWPAASFILYVTSTIVVLVLATLSWKSRGPLALRFSALLTATVLISPHLYVYDLLILAPAFLLLSNWVLAHTTHQQSSTLALLLYLAYVSFLMAPLTNITYVQLSVPILFALQWVLFRVVTEDDQLAFRGLATGHA